MDHPAEVGIAKLRRAVNVRSVARAASAGVRLPVGNTLDTLLPTAIYISVVSIIDESFEEYLREKHPDAKHYNFNSRIQCLATRADLIDPIRMHDVRRKRNSLAHDADASASWRDIDTLFQIAEEELRQLGLLPCMPDDAEER